MASVLLSWLLWKCKKGKKEGCNRIQGLRQHPQMPFAAMDTKTNGWMWKEVAEVKDQWVIGKLVDSL